MLAFVTGGVRSGKSQFAESLAMKIAKRDNKSLYYIATSLRTDQEMDERIKRHQANRSNHQLPWGTCEKSKDVGMLAERFSKKDVILLDCLTILLSNEMFHASRQEFSNEFSNKLFLKIVREIEKLKMASHTLIIVTNEVFHEKVSTDRGVFLYTKLLGKLHQHLVESSDAAFSVEYGVPIVKKGSCI
ncbi:bifunctional adenosylcobinamide kinase/adenosylcobinamide-phosphate guanylyltransferase [Metabacillus arenae]|uniref:Adenosylcobinamide kinase n=1 Tax=Metabacillus arenae TaxID=2771434 RepID=A0A926RUM9_9BACI|nr:bifunctional adenosylcobinamide kinase/adenosylcobinamide-phosphate guanylyltransferase [Metabacillus arenae]MBD1378708.1 bifunctional adenosylcobinamide kinase/adenosylcobinamide-phosphate guanylyltransferase [Metabacillus arenae]